MVFIFLGLAGIASTIFSIAFIVWIVALIINKKDLIKRAWKFTWISFAVTLVCSLGYGFTLWGVFDSHNDTKQVGKSASERKEEKEEDEEYAKWKQGSDTYTKNAPQKVTFDADVYEDEDEGLDGTATLSSKYNMRNGYKYNYYKDEEGDYFYYSINDKEQVEYNDQYPERRYLKSEFVTVNGNEKYAKAHKSDTHLRPDWTYDWTYEKQVSLEQLKQTGIYTMNPPKRDKVWGGRLSQRFNRQKGYQVNYYYGTAKTDEKDPMKRADKRYATGYYYFDSQGKLVPVDGSINDNEDDLKNNPNKLLQQ